MTGDIFNRPQGFNRLNYPGIFLMDSQMTDIAHFNMVEQQIRPWNVHSPELLDAILRLDRTGFVPEEQRALSFYDVAIRLNDSHSMLAPKIAARLIQTLELQVQDQVLVVGAGSGYSAALCAMLCEHVVCQDSDQRALDRAAHNCAEACVENINFVQVTSGKVAPNREQYDAILMREVQSEKPTLYLEKLAGNGRCAALVGRDGILQLMQYRRIEGDIRERSLVDILAPLEETASEEEFVF